MKDCFVVIHWNYADGMDACVFCNKENARESVEEDVETVEKDLRAQGYEPTTLGDAVGGAEVYVPDSNIYYEWKIIATHIHGGVN